MNGPRKRERKKERRNEGRTKERKNVEEDGGMKEEKQKFDSKENLNKRERDGKEINIKHEYIERKTEEK